MIAIKKNKPGSQGRLKFSEHGAIDLLIVFKRDPVEKYNVIHVWIWSFFGHGFAIRQAQT